MGRRRKTDRHLPRRVVRQHGAFYFLRPYRDADGKHRNRWEHLGRSEADMWRAYAEIDIPDEPLSTLGAIMDRYVREWLETRAEATRVDYLHALSFLRPVFGDVHPAAVKSAHCYQYQAKRAKRAPVRANREIAVLQSVFKFAIRLGVVDRNPVAGVERLPEWPRERMPEAWEIAEFLVDAPALLRAYVPIKVLTGLRQGDMLALRRDQLTDDGIMIRAGKTGKRYLIEWSDELRAAVDLAVAGRTIPSVYVFATSTHRGGGKPGQRYTGSGFRSIWQRQMRKTLKRGRLRESFTEHDLRAHTATELERLEGLRRVQDLLDHASERTSKIYTRAKEPRRVRPLR